MGDAEQGSAGEDTVSAEVTAGEPGHSGPGLRVGVVREVHRGERRVAATPQTAEQIRKLGFEIVVEAGAGERAGFSDAAYAEAGARIADAAKEVWATSDVILKVRPPERLPETGGHEADLLRDGGTVISFVWPAQAGDDLDKLAGREATVLAMDCVPRISRAQSMDALSAMANIAGYRAVIEAANVMPRFFSGQTTAAGRIEPAKVLVIGAGVAGLAAIAAARGLGAIVRAFDTRPEVEEQVKSLGAEFLQVEMEEDGAGEGGYAKVMSKEFIQKEMALFAQQAMEVDAIITTALIPGRPAPKLITEGMVQSMREGSVIVDLAAEQGGNCALTRPGEAREFGGVTVIGYTDLPSRMASQSSQLYGTTLVHLLEEMGGGSGFGVDYDNEVVRGALVLDGGEMRWPPPKPKPPEQSGVTERPGLARSGGKPRDAAIAGEGPQQKGIAAKAKRSQGLVWLLVAGAALFGVGSFAPESFLSHLTVFVLACFVGWQVIWNVTPALHTPLMSVTNAISGIIIIGGMLHLGGEGVSAASVLGALAVFVATINIAGGFWVTNRMLSMFHR